MTDTTSILMIDDDLLQLELTSYQLEQIGFRQLTCFWGPAEALEVLQDPSTDFSVIILDLNMPGMDGLEFLSRLRSTGFSGRLILLSGEDERILESASKLAIAYGLEVLGHLSKPTTQKQLAQLLTQNSLRGEHKPRASVVRAYTAERLQQAIDNDELSVVYQPKVSLRDGRILSAEALVRWKHPEHGTVYPDQFIGVAEESRQIDRLTQIILSKSLKQLASWKEQGLGISVAVNISMDNLTTRSFVSQLEALLANHRIQPSELILEVTESKLMQDYITVLDILTRLRMRHINLSIDDFGTGHSSIAQLRDIPFNELKIDRGFVHMAWKNPTLRAIFLGNVQMAKNLGIRTVAEGVEDADDWNFLVNSGCDVAQGYFIAKPMQGGIVHEWKGNWENDFANL